MSPDVNWILGVIWGLIGACLIAAVQELKLPKAVAVFIFLASAFVLFIIAVLFHSSGEKKDLAPNALALTAPSYGSNFSTTPTQPYHSATPSNTPPNIEVPRPPVDNTEQIEDEVYLWKSNLESRDINSLVNQYADNLDYYYTRRKTTLSFVRNEKQEAFTRFDNIQFSIDNMRITTHSGGERAIAIFDKGWSFSGSRKGFSGKVQSQLLFKKINGQWFIAGEKDLETYFVNK